MADTVPAAPAAPQPEPQLTGWPAIVKVALGLTSDRVVTWALVIALLYIGPRMLQNLSDGSQRVTQEQGELNRQLWIERDTKQRQIDELRDKTFVEALKSEGDRNRRSQETQTKSLYDATLKLSVDIGRLDATNQRLEKTIDSLGKKLGPEQIECDPADVWQRLWPRDGDGTVREPHLPRHGRGAELAVVNDPRHPADDHE